MQIKSIKRRRMKVSLKWLSGIKKKSNQKYDFLKNPKFSEFPNKYLQCQRVVEPYLDIWHAKFQVDIFVFGKHMAQNRIC